MFKIPEPVQQNETARLRYALTSKLVLNSARSQSSKTFRMLVPSMSSMVLALAASLILTYQLAG